MRIENTEIKSAEDGQMLVIDLAGAENAADSQFHDKSRIKETKAINSSLMTLKECIKNRAKSVQDPSTFVHIPFRQAKLMLVMKDAFELESHKLSRCSKCFQGFFSSSYFFSGQLFLPVLPPPSLTRQ